MFETFTSPHRDRLPVPRYAQLPWAFLPHTFHHDFHLQSWGQAPSVTENSRGQGQVPSTVIILFIDRMPVFFRVLNQKLRDSVLQGPLRKVGKFQTEVFIISVSREVTPRDLGLRMQWEQKLSTVINDQMRRITSQSCIQDGESNRLQA